jgi:hypothetical protein
MRYCAVFCCCDATLASCYLSILGRGACRLHDGRTAPLVGNHPEIPAASAASGLLTPVTPFISQRRPLRGTKLLALKSVVGTAGGGARFLRCLRLTEPIGLDKCVYMRLSLHCASLGEHPNRAPRPCPALPPTPRIPRPTTSGGPRRAPRKAGSCCRLSNRSGARGRSWPEKRSTGEDPLCEHVGAMAAPRCGGEVTTVS